MDIYIKMSHFHIFSFFWFSHMILSDPLILLVSQLKIGASDDVTNKVTHRIFKSDLLEFCVNFVV